MRLSNAFLYQYLSCALILCAAAGCYPRYRPPTANEPHALVKVRVNYHSQPGPQVDERVTIDGHTVPVPHLEARRAPRTTAVRVRPTFSRWSMGAEFFHLITRQVQQNYTETEQYACGTQRTGFGNNTSTQTRYCTRTHQRTRWVTQTQRVVDGSCRSGFALAAQVGATYLVQYDFYAHGQCAARCFEQRPAPDGQFTMQPCAAPVAAAQ